jgi:hypothetical protein
VASTVELAAGSTRARRFRAARRGPNDQTSKRPLAIIILVAIFGSIGLASALGTGGPPPARSRPASRRANTREPTTCGHPRFLHLAPGFRGLLHSIGRHHGRLRGRKPDIASPAWRRSSWANCPRARRSAPDR